MGEKKIMQQLLAFTKLTLGVLLLNNRVSTRQLKKQCKGVYAYPTNYSLVGLSVITHRIF